MEPALRATPQPFPILPRLTMGESQGKPYASVFFLALTARRGTVRIASKEHTAVLSQPYIITGRFDIPTIDLKLDPAVDPENWWEGKMAAAMHWVDGRFYTLRASPAGDKLFVSPKKNKTFHPGDEIEVKAVLVDPGLDLMIRRLDDTSRKEKKTSKQGTEETSYERDVSLDPTVTITDSSGKTIAEGTLPFG